MATEHATRVLKTYRKKLSTAKEEPSLDALETELELALKLVKEKKGARSPKRADPGVKMPGSDDMNELAVLLNKTNLSERSPSTKDRVSVKA